MRQNKCLKPRRTLVRRLMLLFIALILLSAWACSLSKPSEAPEQTASTPPSPTSPSPTPVPTSKDETVVAKPAQTVTNTARPPEPTPELMPEPTLKPTPELMPEPTLEPTPELMPEPTPELMPEPTPAAASNTQAESDVLLQPVVLLQPSDLRYLGAFRLPNGDERPKTFAYGGRAMTFNPNGDPAGPADGFSGSLFIMGHARMAYGELPDGNQVGEINIPAPLQANSPAGLAQAEFIQGFHNVAAGFFTEFEELPRVGMQYLDTPATGARIHLCWGQHFEPETPIATHAWFDPANLASPNIQGTWFIGNRSFYSVNGYMLEIPADWADAYAAGRYLASGRYRDGGWSGMGPALFAYRPWLDDSGTPAAPGTHLQETTLLLYENSSNTSNIERTLNGYQHPDEWEGGAWITTSSDKSALLFVGTKGTGAKYWYGFSNPAGSEYPCVAEDFVGQFDVCRLADGTPCPPEDLTECENHPDNRGWWSSSFKAQFILYDPAELARVAAGEMKPWQPQPYAALNIDEHLFLNPAGIEPEMLGVGVQRKYRIGDVAYDRNNDLLYVLELFADETRPVVHVWRLL